MFSHRVRFLQEMNAQAVGSPSTFPSGLAGATTTSPAKLPNGFIQQKTPTSNATASVAIATDDGIETLLCTGTVAQTVTLPAAASNLGRRISIKKTVATGSVIIDPNASELFETATTYTMNLVGECVQAVSDGTKWHIIATHALKPSFLARMSTTQSTNNSTEILLNFDTIAGTNPNAGHDTHSGFNTTSHLYTVPEAGQWIVFAYADLDSVAASAAQGIILKVNGTVVHSEFFETPIAGLKSRNSLSIPLILAQGDTLGVYIYHGDVNARNVVVATSVPYYTPSFGGYLNSRTT